MIVASLRIRLPEGLWIDELSRSHPRATFRLLTGVRAEETAVELGEVVADAPGEIVDEIAAHPAVASLDRLEATEDRALVRYESTDTALYEFVQGAGVPPEFPIVARDGWFELEFTGTREEFDALRDALDAGGRPYELRSLVTATASEGVLTDRQREVLEAGLREGYFEVPRECTLEELASTLDLDKSTVSGILRRGERRVLTRVLAGADGEAHRAAGGSL